VIGGFTDDSKKSTGYKKPVDYDDYNDYINSIETIKYSDYLADKLAGRFEDTIKYSDYIAENLENVKSYSEYIAESIGEKMGLPEFEFAPPPPPPPPPPPSRADQFDELTRRMQKLTSNGKYLTKEEYDDFLNKKKRTPINKSIIEKLREKEEVVSNSVKITGISFDEELTKFLNWDDLEIFVKNIDTLEAVGRSSDKSTVVRFKNEKDEEIFVSIRNDNFYTYKGRIEPFYNEISESEKKLSELSIQINEKEIELQKLGDIENIEIDNNTLDLINDYTEKIKNYFDTNLSDENSLDLEKSNMKILMGVDMLKI
jgi:hypothetical protein